MLRCKISTWLTAALSQKHELPRRSIAVRFNLNEQTSDRRGFTTLCANWRPEQVQQNPYSIT
jgi:hypothetical protein